MFFILHNLFAIIFPNNAANCFGNVFVNVFVNLFVAFLSLSTLPLASSGDGTGWGVGRLAMGTSLGSWWAMGDGRWAEAMGHIATLEKMRKIVRKA